MSLWVEIPVTVLGSVMLWAVGTIVFDAVHYVLHRMLESRWRLLRALAWPHAVHHEWLDRTLTTRWENQTKNIWCHLVPEYLTQAAFTLLTWLVLPAPIVLGCIALQTAVFAGLLSYKGLDINHRAIEILDAYQPSWFALPAYHALHHVHPDAYFSAYSKLVDWIVGGGARLAGRRFALHGGATPFGRALRGGLAREGVTEIAGVDSPAELARRDVDVLVLCDPSAAETPLVEAIIDATRTRQLPPEVWVLHVGDGGARSRHYYGDLRVIYRTIAAPDAAALSDIRAPQTARTALFFIRRGFNYVPAALAPRAMRDFRAFRRLAPEPPAGRRSFMPAPSWPEIRGLGIRGWGLAKNL